MAEVHDHHELQLEITDHPEAKEDSTEQTTDTTNQRTGRASRFKNYKRWFRIVVYTIFVLCGQAAASILGRLYFEKGGNNKWVATLAQLGGFPVLIPFFFLLRKSPTENNIGDPNPPSFFKLLKFVYIPLGLFSAAFCFLFAVGLEYLPVSTVTIISSSQLAFTAFFSYFLNSQKFTPFITNSLVLLTVSSVLLVVNGKSEKPAGVSKRQYAAGYICTVGGAAVYGLLLASQQLAFRKVLKRITLRVVLEVIFFQSMIGSSPIVVGLFASRDWKGLKKEADEYAMGKVSYVMTLIWTATCWQIFAIGTIGLVFELSSLYSISIGTVGLPIVPIIAVFVFHDKMDGIKGISIVLAVWGFISYVYQHYLDHKKSKIENRIASEGAEDGPPGDVIMLTI